MSLSDAAWYDDQYNNRRRVPESAEVLARWAEASAMSRERMTTVADVRYGDEPAETLDVFPSREPGSPVLVFLHGGYWRALDKSDHSFVAPAFVQAGAMVAVPNYGLAPAVPVAQIALQCTRALAWTWRHAQQYGGDPGRIVVVGHSAGAHLAAMLLCCRWAEVGADLPAQLVRGALGLSGLYDLAPLRRAPSLQADLRLTPAEVRRLSPVGFSAPSSPLLALVGADESAEFLRQNQLILEHWGDDAVPVCEALPGRHHFSVMTDLVDPVGRAHAHALRLLELPQRAG